MSAAAPIQGKLRERAGFLDAKKVSVQLEISAASALLRPRGISALRQTIYA